MPTPEQAAQATVHNYLSSAGEYGLQNHLSVGHGNYGADYAIYRHSLTPESVWLAFSNGGMSVRLFVTAAEARLIGEAWIQAAQDAEEAARKRQEQEDWTADRQQTAELEEERMRDCEERGVAYTGPLTICGEDLQQLREVAA